MSAADRMPQRHIVSTLFCVAALVACFVVIHPVLEAAINDEFSYIWIAKGVAETGRIHYDGFSSSILGYVVYLAALLTKLLGFSFTAVRMAVILIAMLNAAVLHRLLLRVIGNNFNAVVITCCIVLSQQALPLSVTFNTDIPGMFAITVPLYFCVRAFQAEKDAAAWKFLALAYASNVFLGSVRQLVWSCALLLVPMVGFKLRHRRGMIATAVTGWLVSAALIGWGMQWFNHQPYAMQESLIVKPYSWVRWLPFEPISLCIQVLPILLGFLPAIFAMKAKMYLRALLITCLVFAGALLINVAFIPRALAPQWGYDLVPSLSFTIFFLVSLVTVLALCTITNPRVAEDHPSELSLANLCFVSVPFLAAFMVLIMTRETRFPRYVLPLLPVVGCMLGRLYAERSPRRRFSEAAVVAFLLLAWNGVAIARDSYSSARANNELETWYRAQGLPRELLQVSFSSDGWYELATGHAINDARVRTPPGAYHMRTVPREQLPCHGVMIWAVPDIHAVYGIGRSAGGCFEPEPLRLTSYRSWLSGKTVTVGLYRYLPEQQVK